jgi:hypothetical protein
MRRTGYRAFILTAIYLSAIAPARPQEAPSTGQTWKTKSPRDWTQQDAKQLLSDSPWVKLVTPQEVRDLSLGERREGGNWDADIGKGVGILGTGIAGSTRAREAIAKAHEKPPVAPVWIRWESALPVRMAESAAGETKAPPLEGDDYALTIYGIPTPNQWRVASELKGVAYLRRGGKKDFKPSRVNILRKDDGTADIVYLFRRSVEITRKDKAVEFHAQVGRLVVDQNFYVEDMQYQGELQLLLPGGSH